MTEPNDPIVTPIADQSAAAPDHRAPDGAPGQNGGRPNGAPGQNGAPTAPGATVFAGPGQNGPGGEPERGTTAAQLRRFIKSRPYVPLHELRRRFELNGECDDVVPMETPSGRCFIGLPEREGQFMADLIRQGEVGVELGHDPEVPIVVGVFPMRPVGR